MASGKALITNTAMLEVWEYVIRRTERGEMVALDFLDVSDGFGSLVHNNILRKMEVQYGMDQASLQWLASYLEDWQQYVVVEAAKSRTRKTTRGAPQGGGDYHQSCGGALKMTYQKRD